MKSRLHLGIDARFATARIKAGLFHHHQELLRAARALNEVETALFLDRWTLKQADRGAVVRELRREFDNMPVHITALPGKLRRLRLALSPLGRVDVFYHVFGGTFDPIPSAANAFLIPDLIPLAIDYPIDGFRERAAAYYRRAVEHGDVLFVFSEHTRRDLSERLGVEASRVVVTPLAASPNYRPIADRKAVASYLQGHGLDGTSYVLAVGTLEPRKNLEILVRAFARMRRAHPKLSHTLVLCGEKWVGYEPVFAAISDEGMSEHVKYIGRVEHIESLYNGADLFVFPSRYEGFGLPPLEAMACGVPVIAARATSVPEVIGDAGLLFEPDDADRLAQLMADVLQNPAVAARMKQAGLERAKHYSWRSTARLFVDGLHQALETRKDRERRRSARA